MKKRSELLLELAKFFNNDVKEIVEQYNIERKEVLWPITIRNICCWTCIISFILTLLGYPKFYLSILLAIIVYAISKLLTKNYKYKNLATYDEYEEIEFGYEFALKKRIMSKILSIFGDGYYWRKCNFSYEKAGDFEILPDTESSICDDYISNQSLEVPIKIIEVKSGIYAYLTNIKKWIYHIFTFSPLLLKIILFVITILILLVLIFLLSVIINLNNLMEICLGGIFFLVFAISSILIPAIIITILLSLWKLLQALEPGTSLKYVIIQYSIPKKFKDNTIIFENNHRFIPKFPNKYERVYLEDVDFEHKYDIYSTNQIEARYLLTTGFMKRFNDIKTTFNTKKIRAEFKNGELIIMLEIKNDLFNLANLKNETSFKSFQKVFDEIYSILKLAEQLNLYSNTGL